MAKTYGICRILGERGGAPTLKVNQDYWKFPANLTQLQRIDSLLLSGFCYSVMQIPQLFAQEQKGAASSALIGVEDQYENEYAVLHAKMAGDTEFSCCEQRKTCPYIEALIVESASYRHDNLIKNFFKRSLGKKESIHNVKPVKQMRANLFYLQDPFYYGQRLCDFVNKNLSNEVKYDVCQTVETNVQLDLTGLGEKGDYGGIGMRKYAPVGVMLFPFCEYLPPQRNPGVVSFEGISGTNLMPPTDLFSGWISALQNYFNSYLGTGFRNLEFQTRDSSIHIHASRRNSLFCVISSRGGREIPLLEIKHRVRKAVEGSKIKTGISDGLCTSFDKIGFEYDSPESEASAIVLKMRPELEEEARNLWAALHN